jgi:hypothetical protein
MTEETLEEVRTLIDQLLAIQHGSPEAAVIVQELEALIDVARGPDAAHNHTTQGGREWTSLRT